MKESSVVSIGPQDTHRTKGSAVGGGKREMKTDILKRNSGKYDFLS